MPPVLVAVPTWPGSLLAFRDAIGRCSKDERVGQPARHVLALQVFITSLENLLQLQQVAGAANSRVFLKYLCRTSSMIPTLLADSYRQHQ
jgi:hypothetical protein